MCIDNQEADPMCSRLACCGGLADRDRLDMPSSLPEVPPHEGADAASKRMIRSEGSQTAKSAGRAEGPPPMQEFHASCL